MGWRSSGGLDSVARGDRFDGSLGSCRRSFDVSRCSVGGVGRGPGQAVAPGGALQQWRTVQVRALAGPGLAEPEQHRGMPVRPVHVVHLVQWPVGTARLTRQAGGPPARVGVQRDRLDARWLVTRRPLLEASGPNPVAPRPYVGWCRLPPVKPATRRTPCLDMTAASSVLRCVTNEGRGSRLAPLGWGAPRS